MVVDFPAPLAPMRATISPSLTSRLIPWRAWIRPYSSVILSISSSIGRYPQVGGDHLRIVPDLGRRPFGDLPAELQYHDPVAHPHDQPHVVLDEQHRHALVVDLPDQAEQPLLLGRVEAGGRLVQAEQGRVGGQ